MMNNGSTHRPPREVHPETILPKVAKPWIGLILGVVVGAGLGIWHPSSLGRLTDGLMSVCHALTVAALVSLAVEFTRWSGRSRTLRQAEADGFADESKWPRKLANESLGGRLSGLYGPSDIEARLDKAARDASTDADLRWWPYQVLAFSLPLFGFFNGWMSIKADPTAATLAKAFLTLPVSILEAGLVLAWSTGLSLAAQAQFAKWRSLASGLLSIGSPLLLLILNEAAAEPVLDSEKQPVRSDNGFDWSTAEEGGSSTSDDTADDSVRRENKSTKKVKVEKGGSMFDDLFNSTSTDLDAEMTENMDD